MTFESPDIQGVFRSPTTSAPLGDPPESIRFPADVAGRYSYVDLLAKLLPKDRLNVERHVTMCEMNLGSAHAALWQRTACHLMTICDAQAKTVGRHTMQFFVPDGPYRLQVFALHDQHNGHLLVYAHDVREEAFAGNLVERPTAADSTTYRVCDSHDLLNIDPLDAKTVTPAPYYKEMLGWNRRAIRITLPADATERQLGVVERICEMSKAKWAK